MHGFQQKVVYPLARPPHPTALGRGEHTASDSSTSPNDRVFLFLVFSLPGSSLVPEEACKARVPMGAIHQGAIQDK